MEIGENLLNDHWILDAGDHFDGAAACTTRLNVDIENALQPLRPGHGCATFDRRFLLAVIGRYAFVALPPFRRCHQGTVLTVGRKNAVKSGEVDPRFGHQRRQPGDEAQRLEDHVGSAVPIGGFQFIADVPARR